MLKFCHVLLISILLFTQLSYQTSVNLPVPQQVMLKVTLSIQRLQGLLKYFNTLFENKYAIYQRIELTKQYLQQLSAALAQHSNIIIGNTNTINGNKNFVIGNYNNIKGNNNWVFVSQYSGQVNGNLLIGNWRIQLDKSNLILINSRFAISLLNDPRNDYIRNKYTRMNRQMCNWDKWANPLNANADAYWKNFVGYDVWKSNFLAALGYTLGQTVTGVTNLVGDTVGGLLTILL